MIYASHRAKRPLARTRPTPLVYCWLPRAQMVIFLISLIPIIGALVLVVIGVIDIILLIVCAAGVDALRGVSGWKIAASPSAAA
ncbi:MAG: hypothetical protein R2867_22180 [Caldilineaceae bacterium]